MSRKAGSDAFKRELSQAERNRRAREEKSNNPEIAKRRAGKARGLGFNLSGYSDKEISMALQGDKFDAQDYKRLTGKDYVAPGNNDDASPRPPQVPPQGSGGQATEDVSGGDNSITSPISQDNDIAITGDSNQVDQDNSINQTIDSRDQSDNRRYYGGSSRIFNYQGGKGESKLYDSPVSMATMGGFYDTDDSPAAAAKFMDMYIDSNILNQKDIRKDYDKYKITDYSPNDPNRISELEGRLDRSIKGSRDRAKNQETAMFGKNPFTGTFQLPQLPDPMEDKTKNIYEDAIDRIKDV